MRQSLGKNEVLTLTCEWGNTLPFDGVLTCLILGLTAVVGRGNGNNWKRRPISRHLYSIAVVVFMLCILFASYFAVCIDRAFTIFYHMN
jgi:hypothetical protein